MSDYPTLTLEKIRAAQSPREVAAYLLRVSDAVMVTYGAQLAAECRRKDFAAGAEFIEHRLGLLHLVRDAHGLLPEGAHLEVELWRHTLSDFAAGRALELPTFMRGEGE